MIDLASTVLAFLVETTPPKIHTPRKPQTSQTLIIQPLAPLAFIPFHYAPVGTYANPYPYGQCTYGVASMKGNIPVWGNAADWAWEAREAGYTVSDTPIVGSVAQTSAGYWGHVATVVGVGDGTVTVIEQNYDYNGSIREYTYPTSTFVYIYM